MAADFLPDGEQLFIVAADADGNIHVLQFDPERTSPPTFQFNLSPHAFPTKSLPLPPSHRPKAQAELTGEKTPNP